VSNNPIWGTSGGAFLAVSDVLGDDYWYFTLFSSSQTSGEFLRSLSFAVSRVQLHRRANTGYGVFRLAGRRYDITDPDASRTFPVFWETVYGGYGAMSYPISKFRRLEVNTTLAWSDKDIFFNDIRRKALLLSNSVALVHDNALYGYNGPIDGWRANLTLAYTTDVRYSNVSYYTLSADLRHYWRIFRDVSFASRGLVQLNQGREARLFILGGSWDLRGRRLWSVRARKLWFTSHELRFPILNRPSLYVPLLAPFGIANLRGALFFDAAHAWNFGYRDYEPDLSTGETIGASGIGFRMNLFGAFVLRYDIGYRFSDGFRTREPGRFHQFFFGYDF
jgi:outer membrane protein assembly factor BamA